MSDLQVGANNDFFESTSGALDLVSKAARDGALDARQAADRAWSSTSLFVSRFLYTTCYTVSYGVVFPATLLARAVPRENAAVRGMIDGAKAAMDRLDGVHAATLDLTDPVPA